MVYANYGRKHKRPRETQYNMIQRNVNIPNIAGKELMCKVNIGHGSTNPILKVPLFVQVSKTPTQTIIFTNFKGKHIWLIRVELQASTHVYWW